MNQSHHLVNFFLKKLLLLPNFNYDTFFVQSALKVLWKFNPNKKHRQNKVSGSSSSTTIPIERSSSSQHVKHFNSSTDSPLEFSQFRRRAKTFTGSGELAHTIAFLKSYSLLKFTKKKNIMQCTM